MATNAVSLKLPEFWETSATAWFAQAEAQFALREITADETKYYVVSALGSATASRVVSILKQPPPENKYGTLKAHLLRTFELSDAERASRLFSLQGLGESKPSELMDKMLDLLGEHKPDFLFIQLFLRLLPPQVRAALANTAICRALAAEADKFFFASQPTYVAAFLTAAAAAPRHQQVSGLCFFHARFGVKARRCRPPCISTHRPTSAGKRQGRRSAVAMSVGQTGRLLFIQDSLSGRRFLCDTGAQRSVLPASRLDMLSESHGPPMEAANGSPICTYGVRYVELCFGGQRFGWNFVTAKVTVPLIGADFLCAFGLLVDVKNRRLVDAVTFCSYECTLGVTDSVRLSSMLPTADIFLCLLTEFPALTQPTFSSATAKHGVEHHIATTGAPVHARARRLDPAKLSIARAEFETMERLGIIRRSKSPWASPLAHGGEAGWGLAAMWRLPQAQRCHHPGPLPCPPHTDFSAHLAGKTVFSKVDLVRGYHQRSTDFSAPDGPVLRDLPFLFVYLDDILVASTSQAEHVAHLRALVQRLSQHGLIINPAKCQFGLSTIDFLGHHVTRYGAVPLPEKVEAIASFPHPVTVKALQEFLGMVNFYHRFLPRAADLMRPLYDCLKGAVPKHMVDWSDMRQRAFENVKAALANATLLAHPLPDAPISITTDASDYAGRSFTAFVDHKPLTFAMAKTAEPWSARQQRHLSYIKHLAGKTNVVADCLSRAVTGAVHMGLDYGQMAVDQTTDSDVQALKSAATGLQLCEVPFGSTGVTLLCDVSTVPERRFDHVYVDLVGPFPPFRGCTYLLTMVDRTTRWPEAVPLQSATSAEVARESLGVKLHHTTAYHPQANGMCERFHRSMKAALRASLKDSSWVDRLPWVLLGLRTAPKDDLQCSSAEMVYGEPLRVPGEFVPNTTAPWSASAQRATLLDAAKVFAPIPISQHGLPPSHVPPSLERADYVFIRHGAHRGPLQPPYDGPFRVLESGDKHFC
ncbi:Retrovirus-related Pol polyprotein from transposon 297 [Takifugu flavidus]|uniref:ribonuclease H n=1 Tax=Takifugu flavidus TaxID=433684 RepID=A0A5C6P3Y4_9TELE|nr:Retrovirus-related Pol polyprotein from transposon 297 [Takifugu flavidus]